MNRTTVILALALVALAGCGATQERDSLREAQVLDDKRDAALREEKRKRDEALAEAAAQVAEARREVGNARRSIREVRSEMGGQQ